MGAMKKTILLGFSLVVLVAVVIGAVVSLSRHTHKVGDNFSVPGAGGGDGLSSSSKTISAMCSVTDYKEACQKSLGGVLQNGTADIKQVVKAAVQVTLDASRSAVENSKAVGNGTVDPMQKAALSDCRQLLQDAVEELQDTFSHLDVNDLRTLPDRADDVKTWLSAVISYQQTCLDGVDHPELKAKVQSLVNDAAQLTSNALAIVAEVFSTFKELQGAGIPMMATESRRRLLQNVGVDLDDGGYPRWFSQADRRLLSGVGRGRVKPNVVVAKDGSGQFSTINAALDAMPKSYSGRYVIYVKAGIYRENVIVTKDKTNVLMYGDGPRKTIVSGKKNFVDGTPTFQTATFAALGNGFVAKSMGFQNTAGPEKHQAVALRVQSDMSAFFNCRMDGFQDTLYVQTHRQFYRHCVISGTIDFIFGDSATVLQNCLIIVRRPMDNQQNTVTAHGRADRHETTGLVIHNCRIVPDQRLFPDRFRLKSYLGRPWKEYSRTVVMESTLGDFIQPEGWMPWDGDFALNTLYYAEYANRGPGARTTARVNWRGFRVIGRKEASQFTVGSFIQGNRWIKYTGTPYLLAFRR